MSKARFVAALSLAAVVAYPAMVAAAEYFRMQLPEVATTSDGPPDVGSNNPIEITAEGGMWRAPANVDIPVLITGGDGTYAIEDNNLDLDWVQTETDGSIGRGRITGQIYTSTSYVMTPFDASGGSGASKTIELQVFPPLLVEVPSDQLQPVSSGMPVAIDAEVASGQIGTITWDWVGGAPSGYTLNSTTGLVTGHAEGPGSVPTMELRATDSMDQASATTGPFTISVVAEPLDVSVSGGTWRLPDPVEILVSKSGSYGELEVATTLPAGLVYDSSTGMITGVVPDTGSKQVLPISVEVSDSYGSPTASDSATVTVLPQMSLSVQTPTNAIVGAEVELHPDVAGVVGSGSWSLRSGALPDGLSLNASTGAISGAPSEPASATGLVLGVVDSEDGSQAVSNGFDIVVTHDLVPDPFSIPAVTGVGVGVMSTSTAISPSGFTADLPISVTNGAEISIAGGAWASAGTIEPGQGFRVRLRSSASYGAAVTTAVSVGTTSANWSVTTKAQDTIPDAFSVQDVLNLAPSVQRVSDSVTPTGYDGTVAISATNGAQVSIDNGPYAASATITAGQSFTVRNTSSATYGASVDSVVTVGGTTDTWTITTKAQDRTPAQFDVVEVSDAELTTSVVSAIVSPTGYEGTVNVSSTNGAQVSVDGGAWTASSTITAGQTFRVRITSSAAFLGSVVSTVTVGTVTDLWEVTSRPQDITPDAFALEDVTGQDVLQEVTSAVVTPVGYEGSIAITVNNGASLSVDGGAFSTNSVIQPGQSFRVRMTSSPYYAQSVSTVVTVGGTTDSWSVSNRVQDATPDAFAIGDATGADPSTTTVSQAVTPVGYEGSVSISASNGGQVSVNNGPWAASSTITSGESFRVRKESSAAFGTTVQTVVTVGGTTGNWSITTRAADLTPDAFAIPAVNGRNPSAQTTSASVTSVGFETAVSISASNGALVSVAGGSYVASTTIASGQSFAVRMDASSSFSTLVATVVTIGGVSATWTVTTRAQDADPDLFLIPTIGGANPSTLTTSASVTPVGYEGSVTISASNGGVVTTDGGTTWSASASIVAGGSFQVRNTSNAAFGGATSTIVSIGSSSATWVINTRAADLTPDAFAIPDLTAQNPATLVTSAAVTPSGYETSVSVSATNGATISVNGGAFVASPTTISSGQSFRVQIASSNAFATALSSVVTVGGVSDTWNVTTRTQDITPAAFTIPDAGNVERSTQTDSTTVTPTGYEGSVTVSTTNGATISINGGAFVASPTTMSAGDGLRVRLTSSGSYSTALTSVVTVGDVSDSWTVTTRAIDATPDAFSIPAVIGQNPSSQAISASVTPAGYEGSVSISATNGAEISVAGGAYAASGTLTVGQSFAVRMNASSAYNTPVSSVVTVGGVAATWTVTTKVQDIAPDAFTIAPVSGVERSAQTTSAVVTPTGYEGVVAISATNGGEITTDGGTTWTASGSLTSGGSFRVRNTSSASFSTAVVTTVNVGSGSASWSLTTRAIDLTPNAFSITDLAGQNLSTQVTSSSVIPTGYEGSVTISATNGAQVSVAALPFATSTTISPGQSFQVRMTSSGSYDATVSSVVTVGGVSATWTVSNRSQDTTPNAFSMVDAVNAERSTVTTSASLVPTGYEGTVTISASNGATISVNGGGFVASPTTILSGQSFQVRNTSSASFSTAVDTVVTVGTISDTWSITTRAMDTTPDAFTVPDIVGQATSTLATSGQIAAAGFDGSLTLAATNGAQVSIVGSGTWAASVSISAGQSFQVRMTSSGSYATAVASTVSIGAVTDNWSVTTKVQDVAPDAFSFPVVTNQEKGATALSSVVTPSGYDAPLSVSVTGGELSVAGGAWAASGSISTGQTIQLRTTASSTFGGSVAPMLTIGTSTVGWTVSTRAQDIAPDAFTIAATTGQNVSITSYSTSVTPTGYEDSVTVTATNGAQVQVAGAGAWATSATLSAGQSFQVRMTSSASYNASVSSTVSVGSGSATWTVQTKVQDTTPDAFTIPALTGQEISTSVSSAAVTPVGYDGTVSITTTNGATISINGGAFSASPRTISAGDSFRVQRSTSASYGSNATTDVTIGTGAAVTWTTTTRAADVVPNAFTITDVSGQNPSAAATSASVIPAGYEVSTSISATNGAQVSVAALPFTTSTTISPGQSFVVRMTASSAFNTPVSTVVTVGGVPSTWTVTTRAQDTTPDAFTISASGGVESSTLTTSASVTPAGFEGSVNISATNGGQVSVAGGAWATSTTITLGQSFVVRNTSSASYSTTVSTVVNVGTGSATWALTTRAIDLTPAAFTIPDLTGQNVSATVTSSAVSVSGFDGSVSIGATNGATVSVAGGAYATSGTISSGQSFTVQMASSASYATTVSTVVTIGGVQDTWSVQTKTQDTTPNAFIIADLTGQERSTAIVSASVAPAGYEGSVTIAATNGAMVSVNGGAYATSTSITAGQSFTVRMTSSSAYVTEVTTVVSVGNTSDTWNVTTRAIDGTPNAFAVVDLSDQDPSTVVTSASVTPVGYEGSVSIGASNGATVSVAGGAYAASGSISVGQSFTVRMTSSAAFGGGVSSIVSVGGVTDTWNVGTRAQDTTPDSFLAVSNEIDAEPSTLTTSGTITPIGFEGSVSISAAGGAQVSVAGGPWVTSGTIAEGQSFLVRNTSSATFGGISTTTITVGGATTTWSITTRAQDTTPNAFTIASVSGVATSSTVTSAAVTPVGYEGSVTISATNAAQISVAGGTYATSATITAGQSFTVRMTSSATTSSSVSTTVAVGNTSTTWTVQTGGGPVTVDYLLVAGGGAGGRGGGGGGGVLQGSFTLSPGTYSVVIGDGGVAAFDTVRSGGNSSFNGLTAIGGGGGGAVQTGAGAAGGSGGGGANGGSVRGTGTAGQGNNGGATSTNGASSGGGGFGGVGVSATTGYTAGAGGAGLNSNISGTMTNYAAGGGGAVFNPPGFGGVVGAAGGDSATPGTFVGSSNATAAPANRGGGGGGSIPADPKVSNRTLQVGGNGGSGVLIIRYLGAPRGTGGTITSDGTYTRHVITSTQNLVIQ